LINGYDKLMHPLQNQGVPTEVFIAGVLLHLQSIDSKAQEVSMMLEFYTGWNDPRLAYGHLNYSEHVETVSFGDTKAEGWQVWKPDLHWQTCSTVKTLGTRYLVSPSGDVEYITQISVTCKCPFSFGRMPFHSQECFVPMNLFDTPVTSVVIRPLPGFGWTIAGGRAPTDPSWENIDITCRMEDYQIVHRPNATVYGRLVLTVSFDPNTSGMTVAVIVPVVVFVLLSYCTTYVTEHPSRTAISVIMTLNLNVAIGKVYGDLPSVSMKPWLVDFLHGCMFICLGAAFLAIIMDFSDAQVAARKKKGEQADEDLKGPDRVWHLISKYVPPVSRVVFILGFAMYLIIMFATVDMYEDSVTPLTHGALPGSEVDC
jgi:hypothetical protein